MPLRHTFTPMLHVSTPHHHLNNLKHANNGIRNRIGQCIWRTVFPISSRHYQADNCSCILLCFQRRCFWPVLTLIHILLLDRIFLTLDSPFQSSLLPFPAAASLPPQFLSDSVSVLSTSLSSGQAHRPSSVHLVPSLSPLWV